MNFETRNSRGRATSLLIEDAARAVISRKGFLNTTVADITAEAGRSTASFYNYFDSKEQLVRHWANQFKEIAVGRARPGFAAGLSPRERINIFTRAHWDTYRECLAQMIGVFQLAMINDEFAHQWSSDCDLLRDGVCEMVRIAQRDGYCPGLSPENTGVAINAMLMHTAYEHLAGDRSSSLTDEEEESIVQSLIAVWYHGIYWKPLDDVQGSA